MDSSLVLAFLGYELSNLLGMTIGMDTQKRKRSAFVCLLMMLLLLVTDYSEDGA